MIGEISPRLLLDLALDVQEGRPRQVLEVKARNERVRTAIEVGIRGCSRLVAESLDLRVDMASVGSLRHASETADLDARRSSGKGDYVLGSKM